MALAMADFDSKEYFRKRAEEERTAADRAADERAAQPHRELAEHYEMKAANGPEPAPDPDGPVNGPLDFTILP